MKKTSHKLALRETMVSYMFLAPALLFFIVFVLVPMGMGMFTSLFKYSMTEFDFIGVDNYVRMFQDAIFLKALRNTLIIVVGSVPIVVIFALFVASQTYERSAFTRSFFRCVFFLPVVTGTVAVAVVWKWVYDPLSGILNYVMKAGGLINSNIMWLGDKRYALDRKSVV